MANSWEFLTKFICFDTFEQAAKLPSCALESRDPKTIISPLLKLACLIKQIPTKGKLLLGLGLYFIRSLFFQMNTNKPCESITVRKD